MQGLGHHRLCNHREHGPGCQTFDNRERLRRGLLEEHAAEGGPDPGNQHNGSPEQSDVPPGEFLLAHPEHRHTVRRVQNLVSHPYAEIQDNLIAAVNQVVVTGDQPLKDGDELAFFPPVTGG